MADKTTQQATHRRILKFPLAPQAVAMPPGARIVDVHCQHGVLTLWAEVDWAAEHEPRVLRAFAVVGTGQTIPDGFHYVGTAHDITVTSGGDKVHYVWHVCEAS
jgi:hypothetical protein